MKNFYDEFPRLTKQDRYGTIIEHGDTFLPLIDGDQHILTHNHPLHGTQCDGNAFEIIGNTKNANNYLARCTRCDVHIVMTKGEFTLEINPGLAAAHGLNATKIEGWEPTSIAQ